MKIPTSFVELDVREDLKLKKEPFQKIMAAVSGLKKGEALILHAPFKPVPLFKVLDKKGFDHEAENIAPKHWRVVFTKRQGE
ncbi:DUF2249 domain-containing protein [Thalassobacillus pellis]|uniref:DUF2249 domain-containing protein n=1 Tax=Thalassobacillus pellis TaxID=748008 RepID=UPI001EF7D831|nr:DUF2249 domain-containing protein [Thalassobacillus pellis]MBM7554053.1 uncharacterized protein (DUF2249 family) [Thalassobacillus pellis]